MQPAQRNSETYLTATVGCGRKNRRDMGHQFVADEQKVAACPYVLYHHRHDEKMKSENIRRSNVGQVLLKENETPS